MKGKSVKKTVILIAVVLLMFSGNYEELSAAESAVEEIEPLSLAASKKVTLTISSAGTAKAVCKVTGDSGGITKIVINMYLQKKNSSGVWENYKSWYSTESSYIHTLTKSCVVSSGTYRVMARVICYNGSDAETSYLYTSAKTY